MLPRVELAEKGVEFWRHPSFLLFQSSHPAVRKYERLSPGKQDAQAVFPERELPCSLSRLCPAPYVSESAPPLEGNRIHLLIL